MQWKRRFEWSESRQNDYLTCERLELTMSAVGLTKAELGMIKEHVKTHQKSVALMRTEHAPTELTLLLSAVGRACRMKLKRTSWSPAADFGYAEFNSKDEMLIVLWVGGSRTELLSVSTTDDVFVEDLEDSLHSSKFYSELVRHGT